MQAIVFHEYGGPETLKLETVPKPEPGPDEVLVRVHASSSNAGDWHLMRADPFLIRLMFGLRRPSINILGVDTAGQIAALGAGVTEWRVGDSVYADLTDSGFGGFAEYVVVKAKDLARKPAGMSYEQAAAVPCAAQTALQALRDTGKLKAGMRVLINGASGGVGHFAVQIAKAYGAEVTGVCSTRNVELVRSLGADHVIDYTQADPTQTEAAYDLILDAAAFRSMFVWRHALQPGGTYIVVGGSTARLFQTMLFGWIGAVFFKRNMRTMLVRPHGRDLDELTGMIDAGKLAPAIDKTYRLREVPEATRYMETGRARGKVVITME